MKRFLFVVYALVVYVVFLCTFLYAVGFVGNFRIELWHGFVFVPKSMDIGGAGAPLWKALIIDALLLGVFAIQHSVMARKGFKDAWTKIVPEAIERSTYVLAASGALILLFAYWRPIGGTVWAVHGSGAKDALLAVSLLGWFIVLISTFLINHFHLFGLQQVYDNLTGKEPSSPKFRTPALYGLVRHPLYFGFLVAFWATPVMTGGHLVFSIATTGYILIAIQLEERDLVRIHGNDYVSYRQRVAMLLPIPRRR